MEKLLFEIKAYPVTFDGLEAQAWLPRGAAEPLPQKVAAVLHLSIYFASGGYSLVKVSNNPFFSDSDTWHENLEEAFAQAEYVFGVTQDRWQTVAD